MLEEVVRPFILTAVLNHNLFRGAALLNGPTNLFDIIGFGVPIRDSEQAEGVRVDVGEAFGDSQHGGTLVRSATGSS